MQINNTTRQVIFDVVRALEDPADFDSFLTNMERQNDESSESLLIQFTFESGYTWGPGKAVWFETTSGKGDEYVLYDAEGHRAVKPLRDIQALILSADPKLIDNETFWRLTDMLGVDYTEE